MYIDSSSIGNREKIIQSEKYWISQISDIHLEMSLAIEDKDKEKLKGRILEDLKRKVDTIPTRISTTLNSKVKDLSIAALEDFLGNIKTLGQVQVKKDDIAIAINALADMRNHLNNLVDRHEKLQHIGDDLTLINLQNLNQDLDSFRESWTQITKDIDLLDYSQQPLKITSAKLTKKLQEHWNQDYLDDEIKNLLITYLSDFNKCFSRVDRELLNLCEELQEGIRRPLIRLITRLS